MEDVVEKVEVKHYLSSGQVEGLFASGPRYRFVEKGHRRGENMYSAMGQIESDGYLIAFFIHKADHRALIISAREMDASARKLYERS